MCLPPLRCLSQQKDGEEEEGSLTVRIAYISLVGSLSFILKFSFDLRKDNLVILMTKSLFPYLRPILLDFWRDNITNLTIKFSFPY